MTQATPVVYEVNIDVHPSIQDQYLEWLRPHITEMHDQIAGLSNIFLSSRPPQVCGSGDDWVGYTVSYHIASRAALDEYLEHRAAAMRASAFTTFGEGKFVASRRILEALPLV